VQTIVEQLVSLDVRDVDELELIISLIFKKALAEPHYCETYANMVFMLKGEMPSFPNPDGGNDVTFKSILLNVCQNEFENMPRKIEISAEEREQCDQEELKFKMSQQKARFLSTACVKSKSHGCD